VPYAVTAQPKLTMCARGIRGREPMHFRPQRPLGRGSTTTDRSCHSVKINRPRVLTWPLPQIATRPQTKTRANSAKQRIAQGDFLPEKAGVERR